MSPDRPKNAILRKLAQLDPEIYARLFEDLRPISLQRGDLAGTARARTDWVYFVESGIVSVTVATRSGHSLEVAIIGSEGVAGIENALGQQPLPYGLVVHMPVVAHRAPTELVRSHILSCTPLHELLMTYSQIVMQQLAQSALCNRFHTSVQRLSRWLLLTAERADTNRFELTHEFVAQMVGAQRSVVTESAATLRRKGIIDYRRGVLTIRDVKQLHKMACECFDAVSRPDSVVSRRITGSATRR